MTEYMPNTQNIFILLTYGETTNFGVLMSCPRNISDEIFCDKVLFLGMFRILPGNINA